MDFCVLCFFFNDDNLSFFTLLFSVFLILLLNPYLIVFCIDCFKCVSMNGQNPECDDPFHNNFSSALLESPCKFIVYVRIPFLFVVFVWCSMGPEDSIIYLFFSNFVVIAAG